MPGQNETCLVLLVKNEEYFCRDVEGKLYTALTPRAEFASVSVFSGPEINEALTKNNIELVVFAEGPAKTVCETAKAITERYPWTQIFLVTRDPPCFSNFAASFPDAQLFCTGTPAGPWQHYARFVRQVLEVLEAGKPAARIFRPKHNAEDVQNALRLAASIRSLIPEERRIYVNEFSDEKEAYLREYRKEDNAVSIYSIISDADGNDDNIYIVEFTPCCPEVVTRYVNRALSKLRRLGVLGEMELKLKS